MPIAAPKLVRIPAERSPQIGATLAKDSRSPARFELERVIADHGFVWLTGIEDTFITAPAPTTGRTLDEYELTGHYAAWRDDLELAAELGVPAMRYGIPWHRINPKADVWDFSWADEPLERLLELRIEPIVDLVHYGLPAWIEGAFLNPDYERYVAEYAARIAERFRGRIRYYTPLNEPRVTAWYTGKLGWWPPYRRGWSGFVAIMLAVCRGIVRTEQALKSADANVLAVHVDATDLYESADPALREQVMLRQELVFLALDLVSGRLDAHHPLHAWLLAHGAPSREIDWFSENALTLDVVGINLYPMFSRKVLKRAGGRLRISMPYAKPDIVAKLAELYHDRYRTPVLITETAAEGSVEKRRAWLEGSVASVADARRRGIPLIGYTWWPMFALVAWAYRQGEKSPDFYLKQMGLWDLEAGADQQLARVRTALVDAYRELAISGSHRVGPVGSAFDTSRSEAHVL